MPNRLISASKVEGTAVYNREGERLGTVEDVMLDKVSGKVAFAVMSFGGFLGIGEKYHPLPWSTLAYDTVQGGYVVDMTREQLQDAPSYGADEGIDFNDDAYGRRVYDYYKAPYWNAGF
ncbi:MAG: PRC-barrel domain containing protein [Azospirillum brasilense]|uniref:Photosystem reaction center subunit H n=1 Tax=Roseomonas gilardii TaxID=257708 RepID=A0A1L7AJP8_9PROT|nr:photosystem reaction center subunit H [Roseomonas gilardii]PZR11798.1 MAG: PRC-barrel domain containing protein [Azospirillum brasilense]